MHFWRKDGIELIDRTCYDRWRLNTSFQKLMVLCSWRHALHHPQMSPKEGALAGVMRSLVSSKEGSRVEVLAMRAELRKKIFCKKWHFISGTKTAMDRDLTERFLQHPFTKKPRPSQLHLFPHELNAGTDWAGVEGRQEGFVTQKLILRGVWTLWSMIRNSW